MKPHGSEGYLHFYASKPASPDVAPIETILLRQVTAVKVLESDSFSLSFRRSQHSFEPDANIPNPSKEVSFVPSLEFQDLTRHLKDAIEHQDPQRIFRSSTEDAAAWVDVIDRVVRTLHHHIEIPVEHGFLVPIRIHLEKSCFSKCRRNTRPFWVAMRIGDKVVSSEHFADGCSLNEIHYFIASPLSFLCIVMYCESKMFGRWSASVAQTVNRTSPSTNEVRFNIDDTICLQANCSVSRIFPRAIVAAESAMQTGIPNDALIFLGYHLREGCPSESWSGHVEQGKVVS